MKHLTFILSIILATVTISSAGGHKGWSWGWIPKPPKQWEKPERPEKPEGDDEEGGKVFGNGNLPEFLVKYDLNEDGVLDEEERQAAKDARKNRAKEKRASWDTDEDGEISKEEREAARDALRAKIEEKRNERFAEVDTDGDGALSAEEFGAIGAIERLGKRFPKSIERIFARLDDDEDGGIAADEFTLHLRHCRHHKGKGDDAGDDADDDNVQVRL